MFQTVIGHLYAGARAYPYVLTQRCNDISFSQVAILAGFNHVCVLSFRFLEERTLEWQQRTNCHASSGDVRFDLFFVKIFSQGMPSQKLLFRKSSPLSGEGWALLVLWISTLVLLFCKQTNCLMWKMLAILVQHPVLCLSFLHYVSFQRNNAANVDRLCKVRRP